MKSIYETIEAFTLHSEFHAKKCKELIENQGLSEALVYCSKQKIEHPQCSLKAQSKHATMLRDKAARMLCDVKWWERRLERKAVQHFEHQQMLAGKVTKYISDETLEYQLNKKKRR